MRTASESCPACYRDTRTNSRTTLTDNVTQSTEATIRIIWQIRGLRWSKFYTRRLMDSFVDSDLRRPPRLYTRSWPRIAEGPCRDVSSSIDGSGRLPVPLSNIPPLFVCWRAHGAKYSVCICASHSLWINYIIIFVFAPPRDRAPGRLTLQVSDVVHGVPLS